MTISKKKKVFDLDKFEPTSKDQLHNNTYIILARQECQ